MLGTIVDYLHGALVPFRLTSYPSAEPLPRVAHPLPHNATLIDTAVVLVEGRVALVCFPAGDVIDYAALGSALGAGAVPATHADLPGELPSAAPPIPPFGQLYGLPIIIDERLEMAAILIIPTFGGNDFFDITYDDWARNEAPRVASFSSPAELPPRTESVGEHAHH